MPVHIYTESNGDDGQLVVVHETGGDSTAYKFSVTEDDDGKTASLRGVIGAQQDADVPEAVTEALEARGYTVETDTTRTDGGRPDDSLQERVQTLREALEAAKDATPPEREEHVKTALGEVMYLAAREGLRTADLNELLTSAVVAPEEEVPYFLNRASDMLEDLEEDIPQQSESPPKPPVAGDEEPPESVRWIDEELGVLELELTRPFIEWIELEVAQHDFDSVEDWVRTQLWVNLTSDLQKRHGFSADVEVELPHDYARRASLWYADRKVRGEVDEADLDAFLFNHMQFRPKWMLGGQPWEIAEEAGINPSDDTGDGDGD